MQTLLNLLAAIALLVWGTHIVRTGILRLYGGDLRRILRRSVARSRFAAFAAGIGVTGLIQSSTATALIVAAFAGRPRDTGLDVARLLKLGEHFETIAPKYREFLDDTRMSTIDTGVLSHQIPGGMFSNMVAQLRQATGEYAKALGLDKDWVIRVIGQVGNYGEIYERNLGAQSPLMIKRGYNALWNDGGLLYAPPPR